MDLQQAIRQSAASRIVLGGALVAKPDLMFAWIGAEADGRGTKVAARALGIRDLVLGAGILAAVGDSRSLRTWLLAAAASDAMDFAASLAGPDAPARKLVMAVAGGATLANLGFVLAS